MSDTQKTENLAPDVENVEAAEAQIPTRETVPQASAAGFYRGDRGRGPRRRGDKRREKKEEDDGFDTRIVNVRRVARMQKGGRRMRLSVFVVVGDRNGKVGAGLGKGADVGSAQKKAVIRAKKNLISVPLRGNTIVHEVNKKYCATRVLLRPAAPGTGIKAGASVKAVLELVGVKDVLSKILGSTNSVNAVYATLLALQDQKKPVQQEQVVEDSSEKMKIPKKHAENSKQE